MLTAEAPEAPELRDVFISWLLTIIVAAGTKTIPDNN